jgi:hypothetical protein
MNERQLAAVLSPLGGTVAGERDARRYVTQAGDGALITTILAVDR